MWSDARAGAFALPFIDALPERAGMMRKRGSSKRCASQRAYLDAIPKNCSTKLRSGQILAAQLSRRLAPARKCATFLRAVAAIGPRGSTLEHTRTRSRQPPLTLGTSSGESTLGQTTGGSGRLRAMASFGSGSDSTDAGRLHLRDNRSDHGARPRPGDSRRARAGSRISTVSTISAISAVPRSSRE
jgi:hypothetical protein